MRILCFTPLHPDYGIRPQTLGSIMALEHDDVLDIHFSQHDNPSESPNDNVTYQHNKARALVLNGDYDGLLSIEADMIVPPDTIDRLIEANADIAYGLYVWRHRLKRWSAYKTLGLWGGESVSYDYTGRDVRESWGKIIDVAGLGMGCTLISRAILKQLEFRLHDGRRDWITEQHAEDFRRLRIDPERERRQMVCDDWLLAMDAQHHGYSQRANLSVVCGHIDGDSVIWPDPKADKFFRVEGV